MTYLLQLNIHKYALLGIPWNIFLALVPCLTVYYLNKSIKSGKWKKLKNIDKIAFILLFLYWLLLLPNTAYLLMIPRHLVDYCINWNIDRVCVTQSWIAMFFVTYALIGMPTFYYALKKMSILTGKLINKKMEYILPIITIPLVSIGVMLGLFDRLNSWDIINKPLNVINTGLSYFTDKVLFFNFLIFTICIYLIYYGMELFIKKIK